MTAIPSSDQKALAMVLLKDETALSPDQLLNAWRSVWPSLNEPTDFQSAPTNGEAGTLTFNYKGFLCAVAPMPVAIPAGELEEPLDSAWLWPGARESVSTSKGHYIVFVSGQGSVLEAFSALTKVIAAAIKGSSGLGVYWGSAGLLIRADLFVELAQEQGDDALMLWVNFRASRDGTGNLLATKGMDAFGLMEIESFRVERSIAELREIAMIFGSYLIENGAIIEDGSTFGRSEDERIRVHHVPSRIDRTKTVYRLEGL